MLILTRYHIWMTKTPALQVQDLIDRISRLAAADDWADDLNPTQMTALTYLARANRFSRSPSQVADFLAVTRGTASQTLKALMRKGLIDETRSEEDRRWLSYSITEAGRAPLARSTAIDDALKHMRSAEISTLVNELENLVRNALQARGKRSFGLCGSCRHHESKTRGGFCTLLKVDLNPEESEQICHEHEASA